MILVGELALWVALLMAAWGAIVSFAGGASRRAELVVSGERALYATFACVALATAGLVVALTTSDFTFKYVASVTSANLPVAYKLTALWGGQAGSLLFWTLILSMFAAVVVATDEGRNRAVTPYVAGTLSIVLLFFLTAISFGDSPYERLDLIPPDGRGLAPRLQTPGMAAYSPTVFLGSIATAIPFAFAIGALLARRLDDEWMLAVRRWSLASWVLLTAGILMGLWTAYVEPGRSAGWWGAGVDDVPLLPWLTTTAFLGSIVVQERRGVPRRSTVILIASSFPLSLFGTFITGGGIPSSPHAYAQPDVGAWIAAFLTLSVATAAYLVASRLRDLQATAHLESPPVRELSSQFNNLLLVLIAFSVLWGTVFPMLGAAVSAERSARPPSVNVPLGLFLLALTAVGPLIVWRRASRAELERQLLAPLAGAVLGVLLLLAAGMREGYALVALGLAAFVLTAIVQQLATDASARRRTHGESPSKALVRLVVRNRRSYGGGIVLAGVVFLAIAFAGLVFSTESDVSLGSGETAELVDPYGRRWAFTSQGVSEFEQLNRRVVAVPLRATRDGTPVGLLRSERRQHIDRRGVPTFEPSTEAGIDYSFRQDTYVVLADVVGDRAELRIAFNPLVAWLWSGGLIVTIGGTMAMWPTRPESDP